MKQEIWGEGMVRVLFTGVGRRVELVQAYREAALVLGEELVVYGADADQTAPAIAFCDRVVPVPQMADGGYIQSLLDVCARDRIDCVIPTIDTDLLLLAESRERFESLGTRVLVSSPELVRVCGDKAQTVALFRSCGLRAPSFVCDWHDYESGFPAFVKPRRGSSSIDAWRVESIEELELLARRIGDYVVQPFIVGMEYTVDAFCDWDGNLLSAVPRERLRVRGGEVSKARICMDDAIISAVERLCEEAKPCGPLSVQLIRDDEGTDWYTEVNPRFAGGAPMSMMAGARTAELVLRLLSGERVERLDASRFTDSTVYGRFDQSMPVRLSCDPARPLGRVGGVVFDLDDTLYPEREYVRSGFRAVSEYLGGGYEERLWRYFEQGLPAIDELLAELGREGEKAAVLEAYRGHRPCIRLYDGVRELLARLRSHGLKVGIVTDGRPEGQRRKIEALDLRYLVDDVIVTDELGGPQFRKPCDIAFRIMQRRWGIPASRMAYVGDNPAKDFQAPRQLGMGCVWFRNEEGLYHEGETRLDWCVTVRGIGELAGVLCP